MALVVDSDALRGEFRRRFDVEPRIFSAPGRVNLIGEHTDYNDGFVLPMAIGRRTRVAASPRGDRRVITYSLALGEVFEFDLERPGPVRRGVWGDYVEGMARALVARGVPVGGANLVVDSTVPPGAGLSASAALELATGFALSALAGRAELDRTTLALAGQAAEHEYVGTLCGIMDQLIAAVAREGSALLIDCRSLQVRNVPLRESARIVVCDTRVRHELASSAYNARRAECREALALMRRHLPDASALRDVSAADLERWGSELPELLLRRARHVVSENGRTIAAAVALEAGHFDNVGRLMLASHASLRDDYQVSSPELDAAVETALGVPGVYGARMTGGGFGGCAIALATGDAFEPLSAAWQRELSVRFGRPVDVFETSAGGGAAEE